MTQVNLAEIKEVAREFLRKEYGIRLKIPIIRNGRLRTSLGRFIESTEGNPLRIEIAEKAMKYASKAVLVDLIKHECVHYALCVEGEPNNDGNPHFEAELKRLGISNNYDTPYKEYVGEVYVFRCKQCGKRAEGTQKAMYKAKGIGYLSRCCRAALKYECTEIYDGERLVTKI